MAKKSSGRLRGNVSGWFTMNGQHIPIMKGETKASAAKRKIAQNTVKNKSTKSKSKEKTSKEIREELTKLKNKNKRLKSMSQEKANLNVRIYNLERQLNIARFREKQAKSKNR